jgi:hypothetical protein
MKVGGYQDCKYSVYINGILKLDFETGIIEYNGLNLNVIIFYCKILKEDKF